MTTLRILVSFAAASTFIVGLSASQVEEMASRIARIEAEMVTKNERIAVLEAAMKSAINIFTDALEARDTSTSTTTTTTTTTTTKTKRGEFSQRKSGLINIFSKGCQFKQLKYI